MYANAVTCVVSSIVRSASGSYSGRIARSYQLSVTAIVQNEAPEFTLMAGDLTAAL